MRNPTELPRSESLKVHVASAAELSPRVREEILALCHRAYDEDLRATFQTFTDPMHVLGTTDGVLVSHALWVTRWLAPGREPPLRTAYVEAVATDPAHQGWGFGSAVMRMLVSQVAGFELAALSPTDRGLRFYRRLGWEEWSGRLFIRQGSNLIETPDEGVMIHRLPGSPRVDPKDSLSAEWRPGEPW